jgi:hypothetical protein
MRDQFGAVDSLEGAAIVANQQQEIGFYIAAFPNVAGEAVSAVSSETYVAKAVQPKSDV